MTDRLKITQWAENDRPREKMMRQGASVLTNAELLAILIGSGNTDETAVELMRRVLDGCKNSLSELGKCSVEELCRYKGIGEAKAVTILAASELGKRRREEEPPERRQIRSSMDIYTYFHPLLCDLAVEECWVMLLNQAARMIDAVCIGRGGMASTSVDVRCILREALLKRAVSIILCHNHPSGNRQPSREDDRLTKSVSDASKLMNIRLLDHVIVTETSFYSYVDEGKL